MARERIVFGWDWLRDRIGWAIASAGLYVASPWYRKRIKGFIVAGMKAEAPVLRAVPCCCRSGQPSRRH